MVRKKILTVKEINVMDLGKISAFFQGVLGLIIGVANLISPNVGTMFLTTELLTYSPSLLAALLPISGIIAGFLIGIVTAFLYNIIVKYIGGVRITI